MILRKATQCLLSLFLLLLVVAVAVPNPQEKQYKDRAEYDIITKVYGEADPAAKIVLLDEWTSKYAETDYAIERAQFYLDSFQRTNQSAKAIEAAVNLLELIPASAGAAQAPARFAANYAITRLSPYVGQSGGDFITQMTTAANDLLRGIPGQFATKPDAVAQEAWDNAKTQAEVLAHLAIGWGRMQNKEDSEAEQSFREVLSKDPTRGEVSYWLGQVVLNQGNAELYDVAFASFARAALYDGEGAMAPAGRTQVLEYVQNLIKKNYGEESFKLYWPQLEEMAKAGPLPTKRIELKSDDQLAFDAEQKSRKENPYLWVYKDLKTALSGAQGDATWGRLNGALTPKMRLYVVSASPPERPGTVNLTSEPDGGIEVVLNLENRLRSGLRKGTMLTIDGVASSLRKDPFRLILNDGHTF